MASQVKVRVLRYDAGRSWYQDYEVAYAPPVTVLDLLRIISEGQDPGLAFRSSCGMGKCGSCALSVNGEPVLSCQEVVKGDELVIEPLPNFPVIKDLIVARDRYDAQLAAVLEGVPAFPVMSPRPPDDPTWPECVECLACDAACPLMAEIPERYLGPALLAGTAGFKKAALPQAWESAYYCLLCSECVATCPNGVQVNDVALDARREATAKGRLPAPLQRLGHNIVTARNISGEENRVRLLWREGAPASVAAPGAETLYFVGCVSSLFPSSYGTPQGFMALLEAFGQQVGLLGGDEWCCGYPLILNGMLDEAREVAVHNLHRVRDRGVKRLVMTCPSCYYTWRETYETLTGEETGIEVVHATQWLAALLAQGKVAGHDTPDLEEGHSAPCPYLKELPMTVTYHDPCDLGRRSGIYDAPRQILAAIPGLTLVEMDRNREHALCCGGGGNLESYSPEVMTAIAQQRLEEALEAGAETLVTACPQCERTLRGAARTLGVRLPVVDVVELLWQALARSED
jgi:succinate dehydrogenase/fumarate reductase iron-sulfur protein